MGVIPATCSRNLPRHRQVLLVSVFILASRASAATLTVDCLGDSNTAARFQAGIPQLGWCELIQRWRPDWDVHNHAVVFSTAVWRCDGFIGLFCGDGPTGQMAYALATDHPDVVIAAFGTNDIFNGPFTAEQTFAAYEDMARMADSAGAAFLPALVPPAFGHPQMPEAERLNDMLRGAHAIVLDFWRRIRPVRDFLPGDTIHFNARGQRKRYRAARRALEKMM